MGAGLQVCGSIASQGGSQRCERLAEEGLHRGGDRPVTSSSTRGVARYTRWTVSSNNCCVPKVTAQEVQTQEQSGSLGRSATEVSSGPVYPTKESDFILLPRGTFEDV